MPTSRSAASALVFVALVVLVAPSLAAAQLPANASVPQWGVWFSQDVTTPQQPGSHTWIALDAHDKPWVAYTGEMPTSGRGTPVLSYEKSPGSWQEVRTGVIGLDPAVAVSSNGYPVITYYGGSAAGEMYGRLGVNGWSFETIESGANPTFGQGGIILDASGVAHVAWGQQGPTVAVVYAERSVAGLWSTETVDGAGTGFYTSLAMDSTGVAHIAYGTSTNALWYATRTAPGTWVRELVDPTCSDGISLAFGSDNTPQIACSDFGARGTNYFHKVGGSWAKELVAGQTYLKPFPTFPSIAVDSENQPHVSWGSLYPLSDNPLSPGHPYYASRVNGQWQSELVDGVALESGVWTSLALDHHDRPHMSYWQVELTATAGPSSAQDVVRYAEPVASVALGAAGN